MWREEIFLFFFSGEGGGCVLNFAVSDFERYKDSTNCRADGMMSQWRRSWCYVYYVVGYFCELNRLVLQIVDRIQVEHLLPAEGRRVDAPGIGDHSGNAVMQMGWRRGCVARIAHSADFGALCDEC